jgi:hypothetical protein
MSAMAAVSRRRGGGSLILVVVVVILLALGLAALGAAQQELQRQQEQCSCESGARVVCAWCGKDLGPSDTDGDSHGICEDCIPEVFGSQ